MIAKTTLQWRRRQHDKKSERQWWRKQWWRLRWWRDGTVGDWKEKPAWRLKTPEWPIPPAGSHTHTCELRNYNKHTHTNAYKLMKYEYTHTNKSDEIQIHIRAHPPRRRCSGITCIHLMQSWPTLQRFPQPKICFKMSCECYLPANLPVLFQRRLPLMR